METSSFAFKTRETVETETPASLATSLIVAARFFGRMLPTGSQSSVFSISEFSYINTGNDIGIVIIARPSMPCQ
jgi:hypothetical protein